MGYKHTVSTSNTLLILFNMWVYNDHLASYVAFDVNAFSYLLDNIANTPSNDHNANNSLLSELN
jgi:hypothetical protein